MAAPSFQGLRYEPDFAPVQGVRRSLALMYHEVIAHAFCDPKGAPPKGTDLYKLSEREFTAHVTAIGAAVSNPPLRRADRAETWREERPFFLTFDDGEDSAYTIVADLLEARGWIGHFFVVTDLIGRPRFLSAAQIRELDRRGHVIGSHTCSHPIPISQCSPEQVRREWSQSVRILSDITGRSVLTGSVPGGYYSRPVAEAAVEAGIRFLFTSEPRVGVSRVGDCLVLGRYAMRRGTDPATAAAFAGGRIGPRWRQAIIWNAKKVIKRANAQAYVRARHVLLGSRAGTATAPPRP